MTPQTQAIPLRLKDSDQERLRINHEQRLSELQSNVSDLLSAPGNLIGFRVLTGFGVYTPTSGTKLARLRLQGGGGAGGGTTGTTGLGGGGGGNSGWFLEFLLNFTGGGNYSCGLGGVPVLGNHGGSGGDTTMTLGGVTYTAKGGTGGILATLSTGGISGPFGPSTASSDVSSTGYATFGLGGNSVWVSPGFALGGPGGLSPVGAPGQAVASAGPGTVSGNAGLRGSGGSGGVGNSGGAPQTSIGGAGGAGLILVEEYS